MKKLIIMLLMIPSFLVAQDTTKIPTNVAKQIVVELIQGDSAKAQLKIANEKISTLEQVVVAKDAKLTVYGIKETNYLQQIEAEKGRTSIWQQQFVTLNQDFTLFKRQTFIKNTVLYILVGTLTYLVIKK